MVGGGQHARPERMLTGQTVFFQQCALPWVNQFKKNADSGLYEQLFGLSMIRTGSRGTWKPSSDPRYA